MSDAIKQRVTKVFDRIAEGRDVNALSAIGALVRNGRGIGMTEEEMMKQSGLERDNTLRQVANLEKEGFVHSFICQEGTAGPFARRYKLVNEVAIRFEISRPA